MKYFRLLTRSPFFDKYCGHIFFVTSFILFAIVAVIPQLKTIFPLFDDFWLLGQASHDWVGLIDKPTAGFYRPLFMLLTKLEFEIFGWKHIWGYALISCLFHFCNSCLLSCIMQASGLTRNTAWMAAGLWLVLPVNSESIFWISSQNDLFTSFFLLAGLFFARLSIDASLRSLAYWSYACLGALLMFFSLACKESALFFWPFFAAICWHAKKRIFFDKNFLFTSFLLFLGALAFVILRFETSGTSTQYGNPLTLFKQASLLGNLIEYIKFIFWLPSPSNLLISLAHWALIGGFIIGFMLLLRSIWAWLPLAAAILAFLLPVLWTTAGAGGIAGGRLVYVATLPIIWIVAVGFSSSPDWKKSALLSSLAGWMKRMQFGLGLLVMIGSASSLAYAQRLWAESAAIARQVLHQVEHHLDEKKLAITNLPSGFAGGPYIMKCYSFRFYWSDRQHLPAFNCKGKTLGFDQEGGLVEIGDDKEAASYNDYDDTSLTTKKIRLMIASSKECSRISQSECLKKIETKTDRIYTLKFNDKDRLMTSSSVEKETLLKSGWRLATYRSGSDLQLFRHQNSIENRIPLYRCYDGKKHSESIDTICDGSGAKAEGLLGYFDPAAENGVLLPLRRCAGRDTSYVTLEESCEQGDRDLGILGFSPHGP